MEHPLASAVSRATLRRLAGEPSYSRGEDYFRARRVRGLAVRPEVACAEVKGADLYRVELRADADGRLVSSCTCPIGAQDRFCKHCVAVGLELLRDAPKRARTAARRAPLGKVDVAAFEKSIDRATYVRDFVDYAHAPEYADGLHEMADAVEELLEDGHAAEVVHLVESFLDAVEESSWRVDDADGYVGVICERLESLHHEACLRARPDPVALAERLFEWMLQTELEVFYDAVDTYADVLGEVGLTRYAELARAAWEARGADDERFAITHAMELLARRDERIRKRLAGR